MRKYQIVSTLIVLLMTQLSFADVSSHAMPMDSSDCKAIAHACSSAGFVRAGGPGKGFWHDCMKPVLLGQIVAGVNVDPKAVIACRQFKVVKMQNELQQLQQPMPMQTLTH